MKNTVTSVLLILWATTGFSQSFNTQKLDSLFSLLNQNDKFMGSIAVSKNQNPLYTKSIGFIDIEKAIKADESSKYRIGSVSKMFTATLILKAIEEQKLNLNQTIETYFPTIENADKITVENLLNHSSGIYDFTREKDYLKWSTEPRSKQDIMKRIINGETPFEPNEKSQYSNSNYVLLTFLLEETYAKPFKEILETKITTPLKLENTYYGGKINVADNESISYLNLGNWKKGPETNMSIPLGAGAIVSNPIDLNIFIGQLFSGKIVSEKSLELMKAIKNDYGFGMFQFTYFDGPSFGHTGGIDGFQAVAMYFPETELAISITSNALNYPLKDLLVPIQNTFVDTSFNLPKFEKYELGPGDLDKFLGIYSSEAIPPKITITKEGNILIAQATGQPAFSLESKSANNFTFDQAGVQIEFIPSKNEFILKQGGGEFLFAKD